MWARPLLLAGVRCGQQFLLFTHLPRPLIPAVETWEIERVRWLFNMPAKEENETKEHIDHLLDFRDTLTKMCPFLKALQASGSTIVAGVADFFAEVEEAGVHGICVFQKVFLRNGKQLWIDLSVSFTSNWCGSCPVCMFFFAISASGVSQTHSSMLFDFDPDGYFV